VPVSYAALRTLAHRSRIAARAAQCVILALAVLAGGWSARALYQPRVLTTTGQHVLVVADTFYAADTFTVRNDGTATATYQVFPLCAGTPTFSECYPEVSSVTLAPSASQRVIVSYAHAGPLDYADTLKLVARIVSSSGTFADTGRKVVIAKSMYTPYLTRYGTQIVSANGRRSWAFGAFNKGNAGAQYTLSVSCSGALSACILPNGAATMSITIYSGQSSYPALTFTTGAVGTSGQARLIMTAAPRVSDGVVQADTSTVTFNAADLAYPTLYFDSFDDGITTDGYYIVLRDTATVYLNVCDSDGNLGTPTLKGSGIVYSAISNVATTAAGCFTARRLGYKPVFLDGYGDLTATVSDGYHTGIKQVWYEHDGARENTPVITALHPKISLPINTTSSDTFIVANHGHQTLTYPLSLACLSNPSTLSCSMSSSYASVTLAAGASARVPVTYSVGGVGSAVTASLSGTFFGAFDTTGTRASFTASAVGTIAPTIAVSPANGTIVTTSPIAQVRVDWCDPDDALTRHDVTWQGVALPNTYVATTRSGCYAAGTSTYTNLSINLWQQSLVATAADAAGHTVTTNTGITFSPPLANFAPKVTPTPDWRVLAAAGSVTAADTFTIRNNGSYTASYSIGVLCGARGTLSGCTSNKSALSLAPGASDDAVVTYTRSGTADLTDTLKLVATYTSPLGGAIADTGRKVVMAPSVQPAPVVKGTHASFTLSPNVIMATGWFTVQNTGTAPAKLQLAYTVGGGFAIRSAVDTLTLQPGQILSPSAAVAAPSSAGMTGTLTLVASYLTTAGQTVSGTASVSLTTGSGSAGAAAISVVGSSAPLLTPNGVSSVGFTVTNTGSASGVVSYSRSCAGSAIAVCGSLSRQVDTLAPNQSAVVTMNVTAGSSVTQTGTVTLTATTGGTTAAATVTIAIGIVNGPLAMAPARLVNAGTSIARDQCLTIAAGDLGAYECGDLRLAHPLPTTTTMNKARTPTLIYMSGHARPVTLVAADVAVDGTICPTQVTATVRFNAADTVQRTLAWTGACGQRATRRVVVPVDAVARGHATGVYSYKLEIRAAANGVNYTVTDTNGVMAVVNRSTSQFGAGWWVDGVEQLVTVPSRSDQLLWVGGDGSTRLYTQQPGTATFLVQPSVDRPDTLEKLSGGTGYRRHLRNSAYVEFDGFLRHSATIDAAGHRTQLYWTSSQLDSITLPIADPANGAARRTYKFSYTAGLFSSLASPGPSGARLTTVSRVVQSGTTDVGIIDPGDPAVHYISDATGRITVRKNRMNDGTRFQYDPASGALTRVAMDITRTSPAVDSIRTSFCAAEATSLAACAATAVDPASVRTLVDGPRPDVADTAAFYLTVFGAPQRIVDALGHVTSVEHGDARWPLLATATVQANGHRVEAAYTDRGLIDAARDINPLGRDPNEIARTQYQWNTKFDKVDNITAPTGEVTRFGYFANGDRQWQEDGRGSLSRTWFAYDANRQLASIQPPGNAASQLQRLEYDPASGNLIREITPLNDTTFYHRDAVGRVDSTAVPANDTQRRSEKFIFDLADRVLAHRVIGPAVATPRGVAQAVTLVDTTLYDAESRPIDESRRSEPNLTIAGAPQTVFTYDAAGRRTREQQVGGSDQVWSYDPAGNAITWSSGRFSDGSLVVVSTSYDALNRPLRRTIPQVRRLAERGETRQDCQAGPRFPYFSYLTSGPTYDPTTQAFCDGTTPLPQPLVIPADAEDFTYDDLGNLKSANNNDARVSRDYYPNGSLKCETQAIAIFDDLTPLDARFNTHRYRLDYTYDLSGRRLTRTDSVAGCSGCVQTYHYDPLSGLLDATSDQGAGRGLAAFTFQYDSAGRVRSWSANGSTARTDLQYDANGRLRLRTVVGAGTLIYQDFLTSDRSGRITSASISSQFPELARSTSSVYNGLGALAWFSQGDNGTLLDDEFVTDGLGNRISDKRWIDGHYTTHQYRYTRALLDRVDQSTPWQPGDPPPPDVFQKGDTATTTYGPTAAVESQHQTGFVFDPISSGWRPDPASDEWWWHAYGADERLRVSQKSVADPQTRTRTVFSDYRYDALGRRVAARTRWDPYCQRAQPECLSTIERTIWDGDQVLMELRSPAGSEVEYASGNYMGAVRYTHAGGIDEPLAIWKDEVGGLVPHRSWRGAYEAGTPVDQTSGNVTWPARTQDVFHAPDMRVDPIQPTNWIGSIVEGKTDPSGLQYMRNRYYDPKTGRFTQEDPIGLAGGVNLYGFAGGDPINESDPFGLWPCPALCGVSGGVAAGASSLLGGLSAGGPAGWIAIGGLALAGALDYAAGPSGEPLLMTRAPADVSAVALERRSGRSLKKEWEGLHGQPWPPGCVAHHDCPLADGGTDNAGNIVPIPPKDHVD
jgi:RHS repeat-associated protein